MTRLISPLARVTIGTDVFVSGDGILKSVSVELGEDNRSSRCSVNLFDRNLLIGAKYQALSLASGGIVTPEGLLQEKSSTESQTPNNTPVTTSDFKGGDKEATIRAIVAECHKQGVKNNFQIAYILATVEHESKFEPIDEIGGLKKPYAPYFGRGYVQLTHRENYQKYSKLLGKDFVKNPNGVKDPAVAAFILVHGMRTGGFTSKKLSDYINDSKVDFYNARRIVNSTDRAELIAGYARQWVVKLPNYISTTPSTLEVKDKAATDKATSLKDKAESKPPEVAEKGCEIIVELGFTLNQMIAFYFYHVGTTTSRGQLDETTFEGQSIRWVLTRRTQNTAYTKITLRQLAQMICDRYRLKLDMEGSGPIYQYLDATGITDYELLLREARAIGYTIREDKNILILKPVRPNFTGFVITRDILQTIKFGDRASVDRSPTPGTTTSTPAVAAAESKTKNDRKTGKPTQTKTEDSTATGVKTEAKVSVTGAPTSAVHGTTILDTSITGLPKQEIGAIDLADGKAEAAELNTEKKRVKGYESSCSLISTPEILTLVPGSIVGVSNEVAPTPFNREFRVASVRHTLSTSGMRSEIQMYSPQAAKESGTSDTSGASASSSTTTSEIKPGSFIIPMRGVTGEGLGPRSPSRNHYGVDIAAPQGTVIVASADGIAKVAVNPGGYGNFVELTHAGGIRTIYGHLSKASVENGQKVKQGQEIGRCGSTGRSTGPHLHWQIMKNGYAIPPSEIGVIIPQKHRKGFRY